MRLLLLFIPMFVVYLLGVVLDHFEIYELWYGVSPIMHALGGFVTAWTVWQFIRILARKSVKNLPEWAIHLLLLGVVLTIGIAWEWYEFGLEVWFGADIILGIGDTLIDLTMDGVGALVYSFVRQRVDK